MAAGYLFLLRYLINKKRIIDAMKYLKLGQLARKIIISKESIFDGKLISKRFFTENELYTVSGIFEKINFFLKRGRKKEDFFLMRDTLKKEFLEEELEALLVDEKKEKFIEGLYGKKHYEVKFALN